MTCVHSICGLSRRIFLIFSSLLPNFCCDVAYDSRPSDWKYSDPEVFWSSDSSRWESWLIPWYLDIFKIRKDSETAFWGEDEFEHEHPSFASFDFPAFVVNNPDRPDRRHHMRNFLYGLGFTNVSFPAGTSARDIDVGALVESGIVSSEAVTRISSSKEKGTSAVAPYIANALAHLRAIRACVEGGHVFCAVFEDDLNAPMGRAAARAHIAAALLELPAHADMLYLEACYEDCGALAYSPRCPHLARLEGPFCAAAVGARAVQRGVSMRETAQKPAALAKVAAS